jgi:RND family efflux transporter MFP subunit
MELKQKESERKDAERDLERAREKAEISLKEKQAAVTRHEGLVNSTKSRLAKLKQEAESMTIKAPKPGIVHYGDPGRPWEREQIKVGNRVYQGLTIITLPDLSEMEVFIQVHEADIDLVKVGQTVAITLDTYKGKVFGGKVSRVASVAMMDEYWGGDSNNKKFRVEIAMDAPGTDLRAGITAKAEVQVEELANVLYLPIHAVVVEGGERFCFLVEGKTFKKHPIKIGKNNAHYVAVLEGLKEGDKVLLYDPREAGEVEKQGETPQKPESVEPNLALTAPPQEQR